jgi:hypothetical protein
MPIVLRWLLSFRGLIWFCRHSALGIRFGGNGLRSTAEAEEREHGRGRGKGARPRPRKGSTAEAEEWEHRLGRGMNESTADVDAWNGSRKV